MLKKAVKKEYGNPAVDMLLRIVLVLVTGGGGAIVMTEGKRTDVEVIKSEVQTLRADVLRLETEMGKMTDRRSRDRLANDRRFVLLESKLGLQSPPASSRNVESNDAAR